MSTKDETRTNDMADDQPKLQREIDKAGRSGQREESNQAMQVGARRYPEPPIPIQHLLKPSDESELGPTPYYDAPHHRRSEKLKGKIAITTGGACGIGRSVAVLFARDGADVAIVYLEEHDDPKITKQSVEKEGRRCLLIPGDVADPDLCDRAVAQTVNEFGRLDILVNNAGLRLHVSRFEDLTLEHFDKIVKANRTVTSI